MYKRPNILFIMDDQHRFDYLGYAGADFVRTPNIDRLAKRGMVFNHCYSNAPMCSPARIGLATGLRPNRVGCIEDGILPYSTKTFYQRFRNYDYRVGCIGKLDLAKHEEYNGQNGDRPCNYAYGFTHPEECEGKLHAATGTIERPLGPYGNYLKSKNLYEKFKNDYIYRKGNGGILGASHSSVLDTIDYEDTYIGRKAAEWIERVPQDFPWYLLVSFVGPHDPFDPPEEYSAIYKNAEVPKQVYSEEASKPGYINNRRIIGPEDDISDIRRQYCAGITLIDDQIGTILDKLKETGQEDNTYIVFTSDHGEMLGDHGLFLKSVAYEPSIHIPLIIAGPGTSENTVSDAFIEQLDINQTLCELVGIPQLENVDSRSFRNTLENQSERHRDFIVSTIDRFQCIRNEKYKFIMNFNDIWELYDLENDPNEINNIVKDNLDIADMMYTQMFESFYEGKWLR